MANAQGNTVALRYIKEVTLGTTPAGDLQDLNITDVSVEGSVDTTTSTTIRSDRATSDLVPTGGSSTGGFNFELNFAEYDDFILASLGASDYSTLVDYSASTISFANADNSINDSANSFPNTDISAGNWLRVSGTVDNDGIYRVVSATNAKIIVDHGTLTDESAGTSFTIKGQSARNGVTKTGFTIEQEMTDLTNEFILSVGMVVNSMSIEASSGSIITGSFDFMGLETSYPTSGASDTSPTAAVSQSIMSATANVGNIFVDGTDASASGLYTKTLSLTINANARNLDAIGSLYPIDINLGTFGAELALNAYYNDSSLLEKQLSNTALHIAYSFNDAAGNTYVIDMPRAKLSSASSNGKSLDSDVMQDLTATALYDSTDGYMVQVSKLPA